MVFVKTHRPDFVGFFFVFLHVMESHCIKRNYIFGRFMAEHTQVVISIWSRWPSQKKANNNTNSTMLLKYWPQKVILTPANEVSLKSQPVQINMMDKLTFSRDERESESQAVLLKNVEMSDQLTSSGGKKNMVSGKWWLNKPCLSFFFFNNSAIVENGRENEQTLHPRNGRSSGTHLFARCLQGPLKSPRSMRPYYERRSPLLFPLQTRPPRMSYSWKSKDLKGGRHILGESWPSCEWDWLPTSHSSRASGKK